MNERDRTDCCIRGREGGRDRRIQDRELDPHFLCSETQRTPFIPLSLRPSSGSSSAPAASRIHHVSCTPPPEPAQLALCPLSPPSSRALQFRDHTEVALGDGDDDGEVGGLYSVLAAEVATRATSTGERIGVSLVSCRILRQHRVLGLAVAAKRRRTSMIMMMICMRGGLCRVQVGGCLDELCKRSRASKTGNKRVRQQMKRGK